MFAISNTSVYQGPIQDWTPLQAQPQWQGMPDLIFNMGGVNVVVSARANGTDLCLLEISPVDGLSNPYQILTLTVAVGAVKVHRTGKYIHVTGPKWLPVGFAGSYVFSLNGEGNGLQRPTFYRAAAEVDASQMRADIDAAVIAYNSKDFIAHMSVDAISSRGYTKVLYVVHELQTSRILVAGSANGPMDELGSIYNLALSVSNNSSTGLFIQQLNQGRSAISFTSFNIGDMAQLTIAPLVGLPRHEGICPGMCVDSDNLYLAFSSRSSDLLLKSFLVNQMQRPLCDIRISSGQDCPRINCDISGADYIVYQSKSVAWSVHNCTADLLPPLITTSSGAPISTYTISSTSQDLTSPASASIIDTSLHTIDTTSAATVTEVGTTDITVSGTDIGKNTELPISAATRIVTDTSDMPTAEEFSSHASSSPAQTTADITTSCSAIDTSTPAIDPTNNTTNHIDASTSVIDPTNNTTNHIYASSEAPYEQTTAGLTQVSYMSTYTTNTGTHSYTSVPSFTTASTSYIPTTEDNYTMVTRSATSPSSSQSAYILAGVAGVVGLAILAVLLVMALYRRYSHKASSSPHDKDEDKNSEDIVFDANALEMDMIRYPRYMVSESSSTSQLHRNPTFFNSIDRSNV